jgi:hypothetical protein
MSDPTPTPLPIDLPDEAPDQDNPIDAMRMLIAVAAMAAVTALATAILMVAGTGLLAAFLASAVLAVLIVGVWLVWWPSDRRLASVLRWWW